MTKSPNTLKVRGLQEREEKEAYSSAEVEQIVHERTRNLQNESDTLRSENAELREAKETLDAIQRGEVDALMVSTSAGEKVYTLKSAELPYRVLVEQMGEGAATLSTDGMILYSNDSFARLLNTPLEQVIGENIRHFVATPSMMRFERYLENGALSSCTGEVYLVARGGAAVPVHLFLKRLKTEGMDILSLVATNLTEQKRAEETLRRAYDELEDRIKERTAELASVNDHLKMEIIERKQAEEALKYHSILLMNVNDAIIGVDPQFRVTAWNRAAERIYGYAAEEVLGCSFLEVVHPHYIGVSREQVVERLLTTGTIDIEAINYAKDGRAIHIDSHTVTLKDNQGLIIGFVGVNRDITERKKNETSLKEYAAKLKRSNEDLERFAYVSSHDLQEPLRTMVTFTQLLDRRYKGKLDPDADEYIQYIVKGGQRMQSLINDLLEFSRITTKGHDIRPTDATTVVENTLDFLKSSVTSTSATVTYDPLPMVMADADQLQRVFQNLVSNAIKFQKPDVHPVIHISAQSLNGMVQFSVADNGIGIEPQYYDRIFVIFQRLHGADKYEGTGIGLAIIKRIIDRHGGKIWVESEPGNGSTFHFTVPKAKNDPSL